MSSPGTDQSWAAAIETLGLREAALLDASTVDPGRRVYRARDRIYKVVDLGRTNTAHRRRNTPSQEAAILRLVEGPGTPRNVEYKEISNVACLSYSAIEGKRWSDVEAGIGSRMKGSLLLAKLLLRLSLQGVAHGDIFRDNVIVGSDRTVSLIDFDQACCVSRTYALKSNFLGRSRKRGLYGSLFRLVRDDLFKRMASRTR
jgi:predicted Ser/Thr protein kinase